MTETVTYLAGGIPVTGTFTGVPVWNLLSQLGATQNDILTKYLTATGSDGYNVLFSLAEFDPKLGTRHTRWRPLSPTPTAMGP